MAIVALEGMLFYGYHGVYDEEALTGTYYRVDVWAGFDMDKHMTSPVINYESIYACCKKAMDERKILLENIVAEIAENLEARHPEMNSLKIRLSKENPPLGGQVERALVEVERNY